ncbi:DNA internalization-related competence protein ComEC/Rec2 [Paraglaciecola sp.]|uniref:DNA internalization-related competence protein ComEC/Rec2 n=1 Tax=Paraglaciecola sp. TaxID=1920173 RepID=UPI0030F392A8
MDSKLYIFIAACCSSLCWTGLPSIYLICACLMLALISCFFRKIHLLAYCLFGFSWMASVGHWQYSLQLPLSKLEQGVLASGELESLTHPATSQRFNLRIEKIDGESLRWKRLVRVSWAQPTWEIKQGQHVQLMLKLKPPHGLANEGGFNYQQWLFSEGIGASGYVKTSVNNVLLNDNVSFRQLQLDSLLQLNLPQQAWIAALTLGYRGLLDDNDWLLVQSTGIAHLIAISGLHLALVASLSYFMLAWFFGAVVSRFYQLHHINLHKLALLGTVGTTYCYAALAGFALPTARAWIMLLLLISLFLCNIQLSLKRVLLLCSTFFMLVFPLSIFGLSFWLSFSAVLIIIFVFWRWPHKHTGFSVFGALKVMLHIQLGLSLLMLPLVAWQFSYISWISPLVNLLAVPLVTLILVPLCLFGIVCLSLFPQAALWVFSLVDHILGFALYLLHHTQNMPWGVTQLQAIPGLIWALAFIALIVLLLPTIGKYRPIILLLLLPLLSYGFKSKNDNWTIDVLDVGQGTAVLISKDSRVILYDVGPAFPGGFNMADSVILPLLKARGIHTIDKVFISHWDNDHSGSLQILQEQMPIGEVVTTSNSCRLGHQLQWQGLHIQMLWPDDPKLHNDNNSSCVLKVHDNQHAILLPGDIDGKTERQLVALWGDHLKSDILLASHHGSNSSSALSFIGKVKPDYVVFSQGFMNRWNFPRPEVLERFSQFESQLLTTSHAGQVSFKFKYQSPTAPILRTFRQDRYPFWYANFPISEDLIDD